MTALARHLEPDDNPNHGPDCDTDPCGECVEILRDEQQERMADHARDERDEL